LQIRLFAALNLQAQIIGFDIIVREDGTPILLEVNAAPSLTIDHTKADGVRMKSIVDELIKLPLVRDTLLLVTSQLKEPTKRRCVILPLQPTNFSFWATKT
ncbi:hypothetical protein COOONC_00055, partial [Cooperia oncophora]